MKEREKAGKRKKKREYAVWRKMCPGDMANLEAITGLCEYD